MAFTIGYCSFAVLLGLQLLILARPGAIQAIQQPQGSRPQSAIYSSTHRPSSCSTQIVAGERSQRGTFSPIEKSAWRNSQRDSCGHACLHHAKSSTMRKNISDSKTDRLWNMCYIVQADLACNPARTVLLYPEQCLL